MQTNVSEKASRDKFVFVCLLICFKPFNDTLMITLCYAISKNGLYRMTIGFHRQESIAVNRCQEKTGGYCNVNFPRKGKSELVYRSP
jgi:hypothetical protein